MKYLRTMLIAVAALSLGALLGGAGSAQAQLGNGGNAIGSGSEAIAGGAGAADDAPGSRVGSESGPRISTVGQCNANRMRFRTETSAASTTSTNFVNVPNSHRVINIGPGGGCIILTFTGEVLTGSSTGIYLRAVIQGGAVAEPPIVFLGIQSNTGTRPMQFVFANLPAGNHTVRLHFAAFPDGSVTIGSRTMTYQYR